VSRASIERILWMVALVAGALAWSGVRAAEVKTPRVRIPSMDAPAVPRGYGQAALTDAERRVVDGDPFRLERHPASAAFQRQVAGMLPGGGMPFAPPPPPRFRPPLALTGIVGPPWQALLEGIPNQQGAVVVRQGETYGDLRIRTVRPDLVVVQGPDTTWRLTLKPKWQ
jgi:hypothetical protein